MHEIGLLIMTNIMYNYMTLRVYTYKILYCLYNFSGDINLFLNNNSLKG